MALSNTGGPIGSVYDRDTGKLNLENIPTKNLNKYKISGQAGDDIFNAFEEGKNPDDKYIHFFLTLVLEDKIKKDHQTLSTKILQTFLENREYKKKNLKKAYTDIEDSNMIELLDKELTQYILLRSLSRLNREGLIPEKFINELREELYGKENKAVLRVKKEHQINERLKLQP